MILRHSAAAVSLLAPAASARAALHLVPLLFLAGCSLTLPLRGRIVGGDVELIGDATGSLDGSGTIRMTASDGCVCSSTFQYASGGRQGTGTFTCQG